MESKGPLASLKQGKAFFCHPIFLFIAVSLREHIHISVPWKPCFELELLITRKRLQLQFQLSLQSVSVPFLHKSPLANSPRIYKTWGDRPRNLGPKSLPPGLTPMVTPWGCKDLYNSLLTVNNSFPSMSPLMGYTNSWHSKPTSFGFPIAARICAEVSTLMLES